MYVNVHMPYWYFNIIDPDGNTLEITGKKAGYSDAKNIIIRKISGDEVKDAMDLALEVFMQFEAPDYHPSGVETFKRDIAKKCRLFRKSKTGQMPYLWCLRW